MKLNKAFTILLIFLLFMASFGLLSALSAIYRSTPIAAIKITTPYTHGLHQTTVLGTNLTCADDNNCYLTLAGERLDISFGQWGTDCLVTYGSQQASCRVNHLNVTGVRHVHIGHNALDLPSEPLRDIANVSIFANFTEPQWISFGGFLIIGVTLILSGWSWYRAAEITSFSSSRSRWGYSIGMSVVALMILFVGLNATVGTLSNFGLFLPSSLLLPIAFVMASAVFFWWYTLDSPALHLGRRLTFTLGSSVIYLFLGGFVITFQLLFLNFVD